MKELVIIIGTIILGAFIFNLMIGPDKDSFKSQASDTMVQSTMSFQDSYK